MVTARAVLVLVLALVLGCSSKPQPKVDDASHPAPRPDGGTDVADVAPVPSVPGKAGVGEVQIRVTWKNVPTAMRASPGRTACNTPRPAAVAPTTTWGIPEVLVIVDGLADSRPETRVVLADCVLAPRVAAAATVVVESAVDRPVQLVLTRRGDAGKLDALVEGKPRPIQLPIAGHAVRVALEPGGIYQLATGEAEVAWIVAAPAAITDASGGLTLRDIPVGARAVTAWLPPRSGQPARIARGTVTVTANALAELMLEL